MNIDFIKISKISIPISIILFIIATLSIIALEVKQGIEFTGGTEIEIKFKNNINLELLKENLKKIKITNVKYIGSNKNIQIKTNVEAQNLQNKINEITSVINLEQNNTEFKIIKIENIGTEITKETIQNCYIATLLAIIIMAIYLTIRFELIYAISAIITIIHDIIIMLGIIAIFKIELNLIILASIFTIFGYSINDTVIIFDRIREYTKKYKKKNTKEIINDSINSTLSRTIITSLSTTFVSITIMIFGGESLFGFSLMISLGIIIGTISSIFVSAIIVFKIKTTSRFNGYFLKKEESPNSWKKDAR